MVTNDWFALKKCHIVDDKIIIDADSYAIESIEETDGYKVMIYTVFGVLVVGFIIMIGFFSAGIVDDISNRKAIFDISVSIVVVLFAVSVYIFALISIYRRLKYVGRWKINGMKYIYIEESDGPEVYSKLKSIEKRK